jgi:hypothetical protein
MQSDHIEPASVVPLAYRNDETVPLSLTIIRILAILCIIDGSITLSSCAIRMGFLYQPALLVTFLARSSGDALRKLTALLFILECLASAAIVVGAIGCLYRRGNFRRLVIVSYCCTIAILILFGISNVITYLPRGSAYSTLIIGLIAQTFTALMFPVTSVLILSNSGIRKVFDA